MDTTQNPDPPYPVEPVAEQHGRTKKQKKPRDPDAPRPLRIHMIVRGAQVKFHPHVPLVSCHTGASPHASACHQLDNIEAC